MWAFCVLSCSCCMTIALVVNEIAPRPHNSGHYTIDACDVSQFELQVRTLCGLPLTQPRQHSPAIMLNILGDVWFAETVQQKRKPRRGIKFWLCQVRICTCTAKKTPKKAARWGI